MKRLPLVRIRRCGAAVLAAVMVAALCTEGVYDENTSVVYADETAQESEGSTEESEMKYEVDFFDDDASYTSVLYDNTSGLPTSEANCITETEDGFIWIGGYSGLVRYDSESFFRYDASDGISSVVSLYVDSKERLWIGTNDSGAVLMEKDEFTFFDKDDGLNSVSVRSIAEDEAGNIFLATTHGMVYVDTNGEVQLVDDPQINEEYIKELRIGNDGVIYGVTLSGDFFTVDNCKISGYYSGSLYGDIAVSCICPDPNNDGYVYLGTNENSILHGSLSQTIDKYEETKLEEQSYINRLMYIKNYLWICSDDGIGLMNADGKYKKLDNLLANNSIDDIMMDYEGNMWFASSRQGVMKIVENRFDDISLKANLESMVVNTTCIHDDKLYIGTDNGIVVTDDDYNVVDDELAATVGDARVRAIKNDSSGNMWICTYGDLGLIKYEDDGTLTCYNMDNGLASNRVRTVYELADGSMAASANGGVSIIKDDKITTTYDDSSGITNTEILSICQDDDGRLYFGSDGDGIYVIDSNKVSRIGVGDGLKSEVIMQIKKDETNGLYWLITSNSIAYMNSEGNVTTVSNFPYSNNFDIIFNEDKSWVISSNGIYVINTEDMINDVEDMDYMFYSRSSGLPYTPTANSRSYVADDGEFYIACSSGVTSVNINSTMSDNTDTKMAIPYVECDGEYIYAENGVVTIPADTKRISIYGYVFTYSYSMPKVSYILENFDSSETVIEKSDLSAATYTNLSGDTYTFDLSILNPSSLKVENTISLKIVKEKSLYEKAWFRGLLLIAFMLLLYVLYRIALKRKTEALRKEQQRDQTILNQIVAAFAKIIDNKDAYTRGHSFRVAEYTLKIARRMGYSKDELRRIYNIALLHDIGKTSVPDDILNKPGKLTDEEYAIIKTHSPAGREILSGIEAFPELALGAGYHHEKYDGTGYPDHLKGEEIPKVAQIIAVADTFDAMYSTRPYRKKMELSKVLAEIERCKGTQFNPEIADIFIKLVNEGGLDEDDSDIWEDD